MSVYLKIIQGRFVDLKKVGVNDAQYILKLRQDPQKTEFLPRLEISIEEQQKWIREQQKREGDYYFLIKNKSGKNLGTIGVYNISEKMAEIGRWISEGNEIENMESFILSLEWAFEKLEIEKIKSRPMLKNRRVIRLSKKMGFVFKDKETKPDFVLYVGWLSKKRYYEKIRPKTHQVLEKLASNIYQR